MWLLLEIRFEVIFCSHPIVVCGEPGSGKTSLMAKLAASMWSSTGNPVVLRFLGTTGQSTTTRELLRSLCQQIQAINGYDDKVPTVRILVFSYFPFSTQHLQNIL